MKKKIITIEEIEDLEKECSNRADDGGTTFVVNQKQKGSESANTRLMECLCKCSLTSSCGGGGGGGSKITELETEA